MRLELLTGKTQRNKMAATVGRFEEKKTYLIHAKFCRINDNNKYINQSTSNWTSGQHKRGLIENAHLSPYPYRGKKDLIMCDREL